MKTLLPDSLPWQFETPPNVAAVEYPAAGPIPPRHLDALVVWGSDTDLLRDAAVTMPRLRWVQVLSAGTEARTSAGFGPGVTPTAGSGLHDRSVTEHALALILAAARRLDRGFDAQRTHRWASELGGAQPEPSPGRFSTLRNARVLIWGFGSIGQALDPHLVALGAVVPGVEHTGGVRNGFPVITRAEIDRRLPKTDLLVMVPPGQPDTADALDGRLLALLPSHAWLVNGAAVRQSTRMRSSPRSVPGVSAGAPLTS